MDKKVYIIIQEGLEIYKSDKLTYDMCIAHREGLIDVIDISDPNNIRQSLATTTDWAEVQDYE